MTNFFLVTFRNTQNNSQLQSSLHVSLIEKDGREEKLFLFLIIFIFGKLKNDAPICLATSNEIEEYEDLPFPHISTVTYIKQIYAF